MRNLTSVLLKDMCVCVCYVCVRGRKGGGATLQKQATKWLRASSLQMNGCVSAVLRVDRTLVSSRKPASCLLPPQYDALPLLHDAARLNMAETPLLSSWSRFRVDYTCETDWKLAPKMSSFFSKTLRLVSPVGKGFVQSRVLWVRWDRK